MEYRPCYSNLIKGKQGIKISFNLDVLYTYNIYIYIYTVCIGGKTECNEVPHTLFSYIRRMYMECPEFEF